MKHLSNLSEVKAVRFTGPWPEWSHLGRLRRKWTLAQGEMKRDIPITLLWVGCGLVILFQALSFSLGLPASLGVKVGRWGSALLCWELQLGTGTCPPPEMMQCCFPLGWERALNFQLLLCGTPMGIVAPGSSSAKTILHMRVHTPCESLLCRLNLTGPNSSPCKTFPLGSLLSLLPSVGTFFLITLNSVYSHHWLTGVFFMQHTRDAVPVSLLCGNFLVCSEAALR